jgi:hypothetical protein
VAAFDSRIELCTAFGSGFAQLHNKVPRNRSSFVPIADYEHPPRKRAAANARDVAELTVLGSVDVLPHVIRVERVFGGEVELLA